LSEKECCLSDAEELTRDFLNGSDEAWFNLRNIITEKGVAPENIVLVAFMESEDGMEFGLFVTEDSCYEFHRKYDSRNVEKWLEGFDNFDAFSDELYSNYITWGREFLKNRV